MNKKFVFNVLGKMLQMLSLLFILPLITAIIYREDEYLLFLIMIAATFVVGTLLSVLLKPANHTIYAKEGFVIVALSWIVLSAVGAIPFVASGAIKSYVDAFFETVSGFTTTGSSIIDNVEELSRSILMWRSFTHWVGGMGILVFMMAIIPNITDSSIHIMRAEMPGPVVDKIVPKAKDTAKILYLIYVVMTVVETALLICGGMPVYDSVVHAFGTAGTGGFGIKADSIGSYGAYSQWVISVFMLLFGVNFNVFFLLLIKRFKSALKSAELWVYLALCGVSTLIITANIFSVYGNLNDSLRNSFFQVTSIMSTTGFSSADFNTWPLLSKGILLTLMVSGACAGSTAGGLKISRVVLLFKLISAQFKHLVHPRSVETVKLDGKVVEREVLSNVACYFVVYCVIIVAIFFILCFEPLNIETNISATLSCFNNIGPGLGLVGPASSYSLYSPLSKIVLSIAMLLGRLEIFPILIAFMPSTWAKQ